MTAELFCEVRRIWVKKTPEELLRQAILNHMIEKLGFPKTSLCLERALSSLPHLKLHDNIPDRRFDVLCLTKGIHGSYELYPLLLMECKATPITKDVIRQVVGYNHYVQAYFVCVVNPKDVKLGWKDGQTKDYKFIDHIPHFEMLINMLSINNI